ncbi:MAG: hypothetical protein ACJ74G_13435 [Blastocatellia bacterium]
MKLKWAILFTAFLLAIAAPQAGAQTERTLAGEWIMVSSPINGENFSRLGNSLGFPDRDMVFTQEDGLRNGVVLREDVGANVRPLGSWRVMGNRFSAAFQLWCPVADGACGSVIMRGQFLSDTTVKGTMTVFFDQTDEGRPTGYDTWVFSFRGSRKAEGSN